VTRARSILAECATWRTREREGILPHQLSSRHFAGFGTFWEGTRGALDMRSGPTTMRSSRLTHPSFLSPELFWRYERRSIWPQAKQFLILHIFIPLLLLPYDLLYVFAENPPTNLNVCPGGGAAYTHGLDACVRRVLRTHHHAQVVE